MADLVLTDMVHPIEDKQLVGRKGFAVVEHLQTPMDILLLDWDMDTVAHNSQVAGMESHLYWEDMYWCVEMDMFHCADN